MRITGHQSSHDFQQDFTGNQSAWDPKDYHGALPHAFDYKMRVRPEHVMQVRALLQAELTEPGSHHFRLKHILALCEPRKYTDASEKNGLFIQASCLITDGLPNGGSSWSAGVSPRHVLRSVRSPHQFHNEGERNLAGDTCLWGTVLSEDTFEPPIPGMLPHCLFNSLKRYSPYALFGRKLLLPDAEVMSRFLGIGFNFTKPDLGYIHFVWHVCCKGTEAKAIVVPSRQKLEDGKPAHDLPVWTRLEQGLCERMSGPIDIHALRALFSGANEHDSEQTSGFIWKPKFEDTATATHDSKSYFRDTVIFDLLMEFQQRVHQGIDIVGTVLRPDCSETELSTALARFLNRSEDRVLIHATAEFPIRNRKQTPRTDVLVRLQQPSSELDSTGLARLNTHSWYIIECKKGENVTPPEEARAQLEEYAALTALPGQSNSYHEAHLPPAALFLVHFVTKKHGVYEFHDGFESMAGSPPSYLLRVALDPLNPSERPPLKEVFQSIILVKQAHGTDLVFTFKEDDPTPRLPGGKPEPNKRTKLLESPEAAIRRELKEELGLTGGHISRLDPIQMVGPDGRISSEFSEDAISPKTGYLQPYRLMPFLLKLTQKGVHQLMKCLGDHEKYIHRPHLRKFDDWATEGFGYSTAYPLAIQRALLNMGNAAHDYIHNLQCYLSSAPKGDVLLPKGTINLEQQLVPAIRQFLAAGLSHEFQRACVRLGAFDAFSGGMKADLVGGLRIDIHAVLKLDTDELHKHALLMRRVSQTRPDIFPAVLHEQALDDGRVFLVTEQLFKHSTLHEAVYQKETSATALGAILEKTVSALDVIHSIQFKETLDGLDLPVTPDPFFARIESKVRQVLEQDSDYDILWHTQGVIDGTECLPLEQLLKHIGLICQKWAARNEPTLVHGDAHLGNIMFRRYGPKGYRVRLIDPNPMIGFSQPIYDYGKLLHWAEPVGWAKTQPAHCHAEYRRSSIGWTLTTTRNVPPAAESRRETIEALINKAAAERLKPIYGEDFPAMLSISAASAHLGMAALLNREPQKQTQRYVLACALQRLSATLLP